MRKKAWQLRVLLMKENVAELEETLRVGSRSIRHELVDGLPYEAVFFTRASDLQPPKWLSFVGPALAVKPERLLNGTTGGVLLLRAADRVFALTFGYGRSLIDPDAFVRDFGLRVVLNTVDAEKLRSIDHRTMEDLTVSTRRQASRPAPLNVFGLDITRDLVRSVTGVPRESSLGSRITGSDALACALPVDIPGLGVLCERLLSAFESDEYKKDFEFVDQLAKVREPTVLDSLTAALDRDIAAKNLTRLYLAPPEPMDWDRTAGFTYSSSSKATIHADLDMDDFLSGLPAGSVATAESLRRRYIGVRFADADTSSMRWSAFSCLVYETEVDDRLYVLCEGDWYSVDKAFATRVTNDVAALTETSLTLPAARLGENEGDYNERACAETGYLLMDKKMIVLADGRSRIEFCDILSPDGRLIHVKRKTRSATLSHLFAQGVVAAEEFMSDSDFRSRLRSVVEDSYPAHTDMIPIDRPGGGGYSVVFGIVTHPTDSWPRSLPFFSQLNAYNAARMVRRVGLDASLLLIPDDGGISSGLAPREAITA